MKIPSSTLKERIKNVEERFLEADLKGLVVYSTGSSLGFASHTHGYLRYLCNWDPRNLASVLLLVSGEEPILLVPIRSSQLFAMQLLWFRDIRAIPQEKFGQEIASILKPLISGGENMGYIGRAETPAPIYEELLKDTDGVTWVEANQIIDELRIVKDGLAINFHRRAAEICDAMFETFSRELRNGKKAYQLQADLEHTAKYAGCEYASTFLSVSPVVDRPRYAKEECSRVPQPGDQILLGLFIIYEGHWGHAIRTGTIGSPSQAQCRAFDITFEMQEAALECLKPGLDISKVWKASDRVLRKYYPNIRGLDWYCLKTGHSLGLDYSDPILSDVFPGPYELGEEGNWEDEMEKTSIQIQPGMLFELHPNLFIPNEAAAVIGDMVLVTETGNEILNQFPRELIIW